MNDLEKPPPCKNCGHQKEIRMDVDGCLGYLPGVLDACCGHGNNKESYIQFQNGVLIRGFKMVGNTGANADLWIENPNSKLVHKEDCNCEICTRIFDKNANP